jgi:hypothetical protein
VHGTVAVLVALAYSVPSAVGAFFAYRASNRAGAVKQELVTGNDKTVGEMVTEVHGKESQQDTDFETHRA